MKQKGSGFPELVEKIEKLEKRIVEQEKELDALYLILQALMSTN